jgi:hypothetical protein
MGNRPPPGTGTFTQGMPSVVHNLLNIALPVSFAANRGAKPGALGVNKQSLSENSSPVAVPHCATIFSARR